MELKQNNTYCTHKQKHTQKENEKRGIRLCGFRICEVFQSWFRDFQKIGKTLFQCELRFETISFSLDRRKLKKTPCDLWWLMLLKFKVFNRFSPQVECWWTERMFLNISKSVQEFKDLKKSVWGWSWCIEKATMQVFENSKYDGNNCHRGPKSSKRILHVDVE